MITLEALPSSSPKLGAPPPWAAWSSISSGSTTPQVASGAIVAASRGDGFPRTTRADGQGRYRFEHLAPGRWQVERVALGYLHANLLEALDRDDLRAGLLSLMKDLVTEHGGAA